MKLPFRFFSIHPSCPSSFHDGRIISAFDTCGLFLCSGGEVEILCGEQTYHLHVNDMYIYIPSSLVRLKRKSGEVEGLMVEIDLPFLLPLVSSSLSVENLLFIRQNPCITLTGQQYLHLSQLAKTLQHRIEELQQEYKSDSSSLRNLLRQELLKSLGQALFYEVMHIYFANRPLLPLPSGKKDLVFHHFMVSLFHNYRAEREVTFYARQQHIQPRYFSTIIKEKSGLTPMQWIVRMVITESLQLLESSDLSIKEIASKLNFPNQSFFGKYFKQYKGVSPKAYRENINRGGA